MFVVGLFAISTLTAAAGGRPLHQTSTRNGSLVKRSNQHVW